VTCKEGVTAEWNNELWGLVNINSNNNSEISCNIDFIYEGTLVDYVKMMANYSDEIVEDDYGNLRYIGKNPNNYVQFNDELWRIIGVMKDIENADGTKEDKVKLVRSKSIDRHVWASDSINNWETSSLQKMLNEGAYYNRTSGDCLSGYNGTIKTCDFSSTGLTEEAKNMISASVWNLGASDSKSKLAREFYSLERGSTVYEGRPTKWIGKVGLIYPSDYGYATSGGSTTNRVTCLNKILYDWGGNRVSDCKNNDWLFKKDQNLWTLTPYFNDSYVFEIYLTGEANYPGYASETPSSFSMYTFPVVYLESEIGIESGSDGSSAKPFVLQK